MGLFEWQRILAVAIGRRIVPGPQAGVALFVALSSSGISGEDAIVDVGRLSTELGLSERQIWRHFKWLCDHGWLEQTAKPTRGSAGKSGRRARYRLTEPRLDLSLDHGLFGVTDSGVAMSHDVTAPGANRLTSSAGSSDVAPPHAGTVSPSDGSPPLTHSSASPRGSAREPHEFTDANGLACDVCELPANHPRHRVPS